MSMIQNFIDKHNLSDYRLDQFNQHFYKEAVNSYDEFTTFSKVLRKKLKNDFVFSTLKVENC